MYFRIEATQNIKDESSIENYLFRVHTETNHTPTTFMGQKVLYTSVVLGH